jgi:tRNA (guanine37-N1)-methyltransferase
MKFDIISIFPEFFEGPVSCGMLRVAREKGILHINIINPRDFAPDRVVDDYQFGGGAGMVFKPKPLTEAVKSVRTAESQLINLTPKGRRLDQTIVKNLARKKHIIVLCGRYKGIDERVTEIFNPLEISVGDYVLSGGETGALVLIESITRLLPDVLGNRDSADTDSFSGNLLEAPIYTRPETFLRKKVPPVLRNGNHVHIADWRRRKSIEITLARKPELLSEETFSEKDLQILLEVLNGKNS